MLDFTGAPSCGGRVRARAAATMGSVEGGGQCASFEPGRTGAGGRHRMCEGREQRIQSTHAVCVAQGRTNRRTHGGTAARAAGGRRRSWNCASVCGLRRSWTAVGGAARAESGQGVLGQGTPSNKSKCSRLLQNWIPKIDDDEHHKHAVESERNARNTSPGTADTRATSTVLLGS